MMQKQVGTNSSDSSDATTKAYVDNADSGKVDESGLTTKDDTTSLPGSNTVTRLYAGSDNNVLTADLSQASGMDSDSDYNTGSYNR
jgi:hypothetical protein